MATLSHTVTIVCDNADEADIIEAMFNGSEKQRGTGIKTLTRNQLTITVVYNDTTRSME